MRQSATRAVAKRPKPPRKKIKPASATKAKRSSPKKAKRAAPKRITRTSPKTKPSPVAAMQAQISALQTALQEAQARESAIGEVMKVINSSPGNLAPVLEAMLEKALRLCGADLGNLLTYDGECFEAVVGIYGTTGVGDRELSRGRFRPWPGGPLERLVSGEHFTHSEDVRTEVTYQRNADFRGLVDGGGYQSMTHVALRKESQLLGAIVIFFKERRKLTDKQIALLQNFAAQAVIAMENARLITETREALEQQTATAEVLGVINSSPGDLAPVFDAILEKAHSLCGAEFGGLLTYDGEFVRLAAERNLPPAWADHVRGPWLPRHDHPVSRIMRGDRLFQIDDMAEIARTSDDPVVQAAVELGGIRTLLLVPLRKDGAFLGYITAYRQEVRPFNNKQIALLENFAAQAVIAMENARLITETREALEQQTATAEVLGVINSSPGDLTPVFDAILEKAHSLCGATFGALMTLDGERFRTVAAHNVPESFKELVREGLRPTPLNPFGRLMRGEPFVHFDDLAEVAAQVTDDPTPRAAFEIGGIRTQLVVPLRKDDKVVGVITANRREVKPFTEKQISLLQNFAAQAVIAMENARLITETREALEQQTAVSDVLQVISRSTFDLKAVLQTLAETAMRLCGAEMAYMLQREGEAYRTLAAVGSSPELNAVAERYGAFLETHPIVPGRGTLTGRVALEARPVQILDVALDPDYTLNEAVTLGKIHTQLGVPLTREGSPMGVIILSRQRVEAFSEKQIQLVATFADQAVIAMQNARLLSELRERGNELQESLEFQTATSDVLKVMSGSVFDLKPILQTVVTAAVQLCRADQAVIYRHQDGAYRWAAGYSLTPEYERIEREATILPGNGTLIGRVALERGTVQIPDAWTDPLYEVKDDARVGGIHTMLGVPLLLDGFPIGAIGLARKRIEPYTEKQIDLVRTFADQAVIAIENARLIAETHAARDAAETALRELQTAQASLVHAQKMAALGQLTAGIAHEIKNPLNFVNNFAGLSVELLDELKETASPVFAGLDDNKRAEIDETIDLLTNNLEKIAEHGRRADGIVKSMLDHSRGGSGERRDVDLNALVDEALNLAYHGARAQDQNFNITMEREFDRSLRPIEIVPQDVTRVFLNLIGNGFYAAAKRSREATDGYRPVLRVLTRDLGEAVEVRIRDNGTGIPPEIRDKLFQPFVTTKPTGEGTGLGLSISYEIVTQQHGGSIEVHSEPGSYTEFTVRLPRRGNGTGSGNRT